MRRLILILLCASSVLVAQPVTVTILATTDMHGSLVPVDYVTGQPAQHGLAELATLIREARAGSSNTLLIDCGDTIQGTPLEDVYQSIARTGADPAGHRHAANLGGDPGGDPMMRAMNLLGYDAMTVGNHEYNAGPIWRVRGRTRGFLGSRPIPRWPAEAPNTSSPGTS